jgi:hypothetical protein
MPRPVIEAEVKDFIERKLNIQIATIDQEGYLRSSPYGSFMTNTRARYMQLLKRRQRRFRIFEEIKIGFTFLLTTRIIHTRE